MAEIDRLIIERLEQLGRSQVELLHRTGGFPTHWNLIVGRWLANAIEAEAEPTAPAETPEAETLQAPAEAAEERS